MPLSAPLEILNEHGIHARPAAALVRCAQKFPSTDIRLHKDEESFSARSILEVLSANLECGARFTLVAEGPDAEAVIEAFTGLLVSFREQELGH
jgi:phosphocarrier protein